MLIVYLSPRPCGKSSVIAEYFSLGTSLLIKEGYKKPLV